MASVDLLNLQPTTISRDLKGKFILLYGLPKSGKTYTSSLFPKALLCAFEKGYQALPNIHAQDIENWGTFKTVLRQLKQDAVKEKFDTVIIDTVSIAADLCEKYICQREGITQLGEIPFGGGYAKFSAEFNEAFRELSLLGYGIVFIAHSEAVQRKHPTTGEDIEYIRPSLNKRAMSMVNKLVDIICYLNVGFDEEGQAIRTIITRETPYVFAGSRFRFLKPSFPFGYDELVAAVQDAIEMEGKLGATIVDTPDKKGAIARPFSEAMAEAGSVWQKLLEQDSENVDKMTAVVEQVFGRLTKLSTVPETQQELLELAISELKNLLK